MRNSSRLNENKQKFLPNTDRFTMVEVGMKKKPQNKFTSNIFMMHIYGPIKQGSL